MGHILEIEDGILYSTGDNQYGQLGIGSVKDDPLRHKIITGISQYDSIPWIEAKTGENHSVAIKQDKSIWMWGSNIEGQMGQPQEIKYLISPTKKEFPINPSKDIDLNIGMYFTIISQISEKSYCLGTFQNLGSKLVTINREIVLLYYLDITGESFLTVDTGPKTIIARISSGSQLYSDWSGDLVSRDFTTFDQLYIGDYFTLYDPENRERLLYKKVETYQQDDGCCKVNALCMHRKYKELISQVEAIYPEVQVFVLSDLLDASKRPKIVSSRDQYGVEFVFYSALAGIDYMGYAYPKKLDPFTLKGLMLATGTKNLLDVILFGGLFFSENLQDEFNQKTPVERISAKEVFGKSSFPEYFEEVGKCKILPGDSYTLHPEFSYNYIPFNGYPSAPLYFFKLNDKAQPIQYLTANRYYLPLNGLSVQYNELETEEQLLKLFFTDRQSFFRSRPNSKDPTDPIIYRENINLPADSTNRITVEDFFFTPPYLIKQELSQDKSSFSQNFLDPYIRVKAQQPNDTILNCSEWKGQKSIDIILTDWLYACYMIIEFGKNAGHRYITYNIGKDADKLIIYFLGPKTDPELTKQFFGFTKIELKELYDTIRNGIPDASNKPDVAARYEKVVGDSFRILRDVFNTQIQGKIYFDAKTNKPIFRTSFNTLSSMPYVEMIHGLVTYGRLGPFYYHHYIKIPTEKIICYTYFTKELDTNEGKTRYKYKSDRQTLIVPIDVTGKIVPGDTKITYWIRTPESRPEEDKIVRQTLNIRVTSVKYDAALNITKITLDKPMTASYLIGCTRVLGISGTECGPGLYIDIYYNAKNFNMIQALLS